MSTTKKVDKKNRKSKHLFMDTLLPSKNVKKTNNYRNIRGQNQKDKHCKQKGTESGL